MMRKFDRCIGGYAGCGNLGDDAILQAYLGSLTRAERRKTAVLSGCPSWDRRRFGVTCVNRKNPFAVALCLLQSSRFLLGGGSLLQNGTGNLSLLYYLGLLRLARLCGCKTQLLAGGVGPLRGAWAMMAAARELKRCDGIQLRDARSKAYLIEWGISSDALTVGEDPAANLPLPDALRRTFLLQEVGLSDDVSYFCVVLRDPSSQNRNCLHMIAAVIRLFSEQQKLTPVFLIFDKKHDQRVTSWMCRRTNGKIANLREASDALSLISGCRCLLSMRLHALIFAAKSETLAVGVSPNDAEPKLQSFCATHQIPHVIPSRLNVAWLLSQLERI